MYDDDDYDDDYDDDDNGNDNNDDNNDDDDDDDDDDAVEDEVLFKTHWSLSVPSPTINLKNSRACHLVVKHAPLTFFIVSNFQLSSFSARCVTV